jgi:hypothetical protein
MEPSSKTSSELFSHIETVDTGTSSADETSNEQPVFSSAPERRNDRPTHTES